MKQIFDEMQELLSSLLQSGYDSAPPSVPDSFEKLAVRCEDNGLHMGSDLMSRIGNLLKMRNHAMEKNDLAVTDAVCMAVHYIELCENRLDAQRIAQRWEENIKSN